MAAQDSSAGAGVPSAGGGSTSNTATRVSVEMENLTTSNKTTDTSQGQGLLNDVSIPHTSPMTSDFPATTSTGERLGESHHTTPPVETAETSPSSEAAISADTETTPVVAADGGPVLIITLLLPTGARHPYKIDEKYLTKRNVNVPEVTESGKKDPFSISVYTLKELILREWREEWEAAPSSPSSIRLIYFGRLLDDKTALKECRFNAEAANVVHMTVRPQEIVDEEEATKNKASSRNGEASESTAGCRCVIL